MSVDEEFERLKVAASNGDAVAMTTLAKRMIAEPTSAKSAQDGQVLLKKALDAGSGEAAEFIAVMFASGMTGQQNWKTALDYLAVAASLGWDRAARQLSIFANAPHDDGTWNIEQADWQALRKQIDVDALFRIPEKLNLCEAPRIRKFDDFLPQRFCDWMIAMARPNLERARIYDDISSDGRQSETRTNSSMNFGLLDLDLIVLLIQTRISKIANVPLFTMEKSMVLHYNVGEAFDEHYDYLDPNKAAHAADMRQHGQRLATCLIYLNSDFDGAETSFPRINQKFRCDKGGALLFANVDRQGQPDPNTLHAGLPPTRGEKWLFSQWIRSGPLA